MPQIIGRYLWKDFRTHRMPMHRQPPTSGNEGLAPVFVPMFLKPRSGRQALLKNWYDAELVRDGDRWVIRRLRIDIAWRTGDPAAIFG